MASQMKSCRPKTPGGKAAMPESLSLSAITLKSRLSLSTPLPSSFLHSPPFVPHYITTESHLKAKCLIISAIPEGELLTTTGEEFCPSVSCLVLPQ